MARVYTMTIEGFLAQLERLFQDDPGATAVKMHGPHGGNYLRIKPARLSTPDGVGVSYHDPMTYVADRLGLGNTDPQLYHFAGSMLDLSWEDQETLRHAIDHNIPCALRAGLVRILGVEESPYG